VTSILLLLDVFGYIKELQSCAIVLYSARVTIRFHLKSAGCSIIANILISFRDFS